MPRPSCIVCGDTKRRPAIDTALQQGSTITAVAERFKIEHESVRRHARNHLGLPGPSGRKRELTKPTLPAPLAAAFAPTETVEPAPVEVAPIRTPEQVTAKLEWVIASCERMHDEAQRAGDWRLAKQALDTVVATLDKLAKGAGLYSDGTVVNIDNSQKRLEIAADGLSVDEIRSLLAAQARKVALNA